MSHKMEVSFEGDSGADAYYCPICGRIVVLRLDPYKKIVLVEGDKHVAHIISKGGITMLGFAGSRSMGDKGP